MALRTPKRPQPQPLSSQEITAAAERLADRLATSAGSSIGESWQALALDMYDVIPELRAAARITGQSMSQCRLVIARVTDGEPAPLDLGTLEEPGKDVDHPAQKLLENFAGGQGGQAALLDMLGVHLTVTGESIAIGALDTTVPNDSEVAEWAAYSPEQVLARNKKITVKVGDSTTTDVEIDEDEDGVIAVRIWRPHPRFNWQADSAARAALGSMQEIILYDQHIESSAVSRLISAGLLLMPDSMSLPGIPAEEDTEDVELNPFTKFLMKVMSIAIKDRKSAAARVPIVVTGDKEDLEAIRLLDFGTPFDEKVLELRRAAITRLAVAVDMPADLLTGMGELQHWTGALVTQDWVHNYLQALMSLTCGSLTSGWLHPALAELEGADDYDDLIVWFDSSAVRVRENIGPETQWAWDNGLVSDDTARRIFGFDDSDKPSAEETQRHILLEMLYKSPTLAPLVFPLLGITFTPEQLEQAALLSQITHPSLLAPSTEDQPTLPNDPGNNATPSTTGITPTTTTPETNPKAPANPAVGGPIKNGKPPGAGLAGSRTRVLS